MLFVLWQGLLGGSLRVYKNKQAKRLTRQKRTKEEVKIVAKAIVEYNREAFEELGRL